MTVCRTPEFMLFFFTTHVRPIIEYASCLWNTGYVEDLRKLERIQILTSYSYLVGFHGVWGVRKAEKEVGKERGTLYESDAPVPTFNSTIQI